MFNVGDRVKDITDEKEATGTVVETNERGIRIHWDGDDYEGKIFWPDKDFRYASGRNVYLAGPMSGIPYFNFPTFHAAAAKLRDEGHEVFNPAEADIARIGVDPSLDNPTGDVALAAERHGLSRRECLAEDLSWIALHADAIALLPGWENSSGARAEYALAEALGLEVIRL